MFVLTPALIAVVDPSLHQPPIILSYVSKSTNAYE